MWTNAYIMLSYLCYAEADKGNFASISDEEWKQRLTNEQYYVCRQKGTERAFTGYELCFTINARVLPSVSL